MHIYVIERHIQVAMVVKLSAYVSSKDMFKWHGGKIKCTYMSSTDMFKKQGGKIKRNTYVIETHV